MTPALRTRLKLAPAIAIVFLILALLFLAGPRPPVDTALKPLSLPDDLDDYLAQTEAQFTDIVPGTEKTILWANADKTKTPFSIVYLHGFSASRQETAPLSDKLAEKLGANLFYTRLTGHGRTGAAMAEATVNDWLNDANEAFEVGQRLGERVIVIGTSTGGTLAAWLAQQPHTSAAHAYILISPNFAPKNSTAEIFTWPWAEQLAPILVGAEYRWEPLNAQHAQYWTEAYPSTALVTMMSLVNYVRSSSLERIQKPVLVIYSPDDTVVNASEIERRFAQFGSPLKTLVPFTTSENPENHVLAGAILAPSATAPLQKTILDFITSLPQ